MKYRRRRLPIRRWKKIDDKEIRSIPTKDRLMERQQRNEYRTFSVVYNIDVDIMFCSHGPIQASSNKRITKWKISGLIEASTLSARSLFSPKLLSLALLTAGFPTLSMITMAAAASSVGFWTPSVDMYAMASVETQASIPWHRSHASVLHG